MDNLKKSIGVKPLEHVIQKKQLGWCAVGFQNRLQMRYGKRKKEERGTRKY